MARPRAEVLEGLVRDIAHGGDAVVETSRGIVMARGALPGERVRLRLQGRRAGVARGDVMRVLEASPRRVEPACPLVERCGGCPLMTLAHDAQLELKGARVATAVGDGEVGDTGDTGNTGDTGDTGDVAALGSLEVAAGPSTLGYRGRARLAFVSHGKQLTLGYRAPASRSLVDVPACPILTDALQRGLSLARELLGPVLQGKGELALGTGREGRAVVHVGTEQAQSAETYRAAEALAAQDAIAGVSLAIGGAAPACFGEPRQQSTAPDGSPLWAAPDGFAQANPAVNALLVAAAVELAEADDAEVLELYAGHGNFTIPLAARARRLAAIESDRPSAEACRENLVARGLADRARVSCESAAEAVGRGGPVDLVLLDPPRTGARDAIAGIIARKPRRVVYVSCDPATLRRDLKPLREAGYRVDGARAFDMFPHTPHVEAVVRLTR